MPQTWSKIPMQRWYPSPSLWMSLIWFGIANQTLGKRGVSPLSDMELDTRFQRLIGERDPEIDAHPDKASGDIGGFLPWQQAIINNISREYCISFYIILISYIIVIIYRQIIIYIQESGGRIRAFRHISCELWDHAMSIVFAIVTIFWPLRHLVSIFWFIALGVAALLATLNPTGGPFGILQWKNLLRVGCWKRAAWDPAGCWTCIVIVELV